MSLIGNFIEWKFAGAFPLIWNNLLYAVFIGGAVALFVWTPFKKTAIAIGFAGAFGFFGYNLGVKNEHDRMEAQRVIRERQFGEQLDAAREKALEDVRRDPIPDPAVPGAGGVRRKATDKYDLAK